MGWAKYMEDDIEIINERMSRMEDEKSSYTAEQATLKMPVGTLPVVIAEKASVAVKHEGKCIVCKNCGKVFTFSVRDKIFYDKMGWNPPKRCKTCREQRKNQRFMCQAY